jgi:2',3'-cyclic-nucleotide 2'-phosphodiesterase (5'-nucleotidase family)
MNRASRLILAAILWAFAWSFGGCTPGTRTAATPQVQSLTILHMNDLHGHVLPYQDKTIREDQRVGGAAYFAAIIQQERARNPEGTILLSAGDMFQGTPISNLLKGKPVIEIMNHLRFDAMTLGNHEFDWGRDALDELGSAARFPFLAANIAKSGGGGLEGVKPYVLLKRGGMDIAVIGVITPETPYMTKPAHVSDLSFQEPASVLPDLVQKVRREGAGLVIVLSHLGLDADKELARQVSGIDVIVGGHSHTVVSEPVRVNDTLIIQAGSYGAYVGALSLEVDPESRKIVSYPGQNVLRPVVALEQAPSDPAVAALVGRYDRALKPEFARVVGNSEVDLMREAMAESNVGNLIADAIREAGGADIGFQNGGGIRADLPAGDITMEGLYTLLPFDNVVVTMTLKGEQVLQLLEISGELSNKILQVSGLSVVYDLSRPAGSRVARASIRGRSLRRDAFYRVATNDFLASGGDRFTPFKDGSNLVYGDTLRDVVSEYLGKHSPVRPAVEQRIVIKK